MWGWGSTAGNIGETSGLWIVIAINSANIGTKRIVHACAADIAKQTQTIRVRIYCENLNPNSCYVVDRPQGNLSDYGYSHHKYVLKWWLCINIWCRHKQIFNSNMVINSLIWWNNKSHDCVGIKKLGPIFWDYWRWTSLPFVLKVNITLTSRGLEMTGLLPLKSTRPSQSCYLVKIHCCWVKQISQWIYLEQYLHYPRWIPS